MLVQKKHEPEVMVLKLVNNDEIIANVISQDADSYTIERPFVLIATQTGAQFSPMLIMGDESKPMNVYKSQVVVKADPTENMLKGYMSATSKIFTAPKQGIII